MSLNPSIQNVWLQMNYVPPRGPCNFRSSIMVGRCTCLRFMIHPVKASSSFECDGCGHHASFHTLENKYEDEILRKWQDNLTSASSSSSIRSNEQNSINQRKRRRRNVNCSPPLAPPPPPPPPKPLAGIPKLSQFTSLLFSTPHQLSPPSNSTLNPPPNSELHIVDLSDDDHGLPS